MNFVRLIEETMIRSDTTYLDCDLISSIIDFLQISDPICQEKVIDRDRRWIDGRAGEIHYDPTASALSRLMFIITGLEIYKEELHKWPSPDEVAGDEVLPQLVSFILKNKMSPTIQSCIEDFFSSFDNLKGSKVTPEQFEAYKVMYLTGYDPEIEENVSEQRYTRGSWTNPTTSKNKCQIDTGSGIRQRVKLPEATEYPQPGGFPFIHASYPRAGTLCHFLRKPSIQCCLEIECRGNEVKQINELPYEKAWELAEKKYIIPWILEIISDNPDHDIITERTRYIFNKIDDALTKIENKAAISQDSTLLNAMGKLLVSINRLNTQHESMGLIDRRTVTTPPVYAPEKTTEEEKTNPQKKKVVFRPL